MDVPTGAGEPMPVRRRHRHPGQGLIAAGIKAGDRVGIWSPELREWVLLRYATAKAGVVLVNINPAYGSHELADVLR